MSRHLLIFCVVCVLVGVASCASYYQRHYDFNKEFEKGDLPDALKTLQDNHRMAHGKDRFLYFVNNGLLLSILGRYEESNEFFEKAYIFGEDYRKNLSRQALSYLTNPNVKVYHGEDHEHLLVLYFKALNYLKMGKHEEALVECRRLNIRLQQLSERYSSNSDKYRRDAFIHTLMGIIYQASKDYNNAFIAYRNALDVYQTDYAKLFGLQAPEQLKRDLLNTAYWTGFQQEFEQYRDTFNLPDYTPGPPAASLVFFWHNGLGPVKNEWSINFAVTHQLNNQVRFSNNRLNISFPFQVDNDEDRKSLSQLEVFRVAFPRYVERPTYYKNASITVGEEQYPLEMVEDINKIAFHSLRERMLLEFSEGLLRVALKKAAEHAMREENESVGALLGVINAVTEHADTRNWQILPYSIHYARVPLHEGHNTLTFSTNRETQHDEHHFEYTVKGVETLFHTFSSLETMGPTGRGH